MSLFSFFSRRPQSKQTTRIANRARPELEALEDRFLPSANTISGFVYQDLNNNGLFDPGETPIANSTIQLRNANNQLVGTATTDANGFYKFDHDDTLSQAPGTITQTIVYPSTQTDYTLTDVINQFDSSLGTLQSIDITHEGSISSEIKVENTSPVSTSTINGTVAGSLRLLAPGIDSSLNISENAGSFSATVFDGVKDYIGTSGHSFGVKTASGLKTFTLTGSAMDAYKGTGKVTFTENAQAASYAAGGGNLDVSLNSSGQSKVTVVYHYIPANSLKPGNYTLVQTPQPAGFLDGKESANGVVLGTPPGTDTIPVTLVNNDSANNNFGELQAAGISGFVYFDANNDGVKAPTETGIQGVLVTLTGVGNSGPVTKTTTTDANGYYQFLALDPGTYTVQESQPANYLDGKDTVGSLGGSTATNDQIANVVLGSGAMSTSNNFGELKASSLSGFVYVDSNNNGIKDPGELGISGAQVTLTGFDADGPVNKTVTTDQNGYYLFGNLKTGNYVVNETQPANYFDGKDAIGTQGGQAGNDTLTAIALASGVDGLNNNFGELTPAGLSGYVYADANNNGIKDPGETGIANTTVTLTGFDDLGPVLKTATTDANGFYQFQNLRPGNYAVTETQPANYNDGKDTIGSAGGVVANDNFSGIVLGTGVLGVNYNFGEILPDVADLSIVKTASASSVTVGSTLNYTLTITNNGTFTAQNVKVVDTLPPDAVLLTTSGLGWTITPGNGTFTATLPSLAVGASSQIFVTIKVPGVTSTMVNTGTVSSTTPDNNPNNNTSTVITNVINPPGDTFPKTITPLVVDFGVLRIPGKVGLFNVNPTPYIDPNIKGQQAMVDGTIRTLLGRGSSFTEMTNWISQIQSGMTTSQFVAAVWNSDEHRAYQATQFFQVFYNRNPTAAEQAQVAQELKAGMTEIAVATQFLTSAEYQTAHPSAASLVAGYYQDILNKLPDLSTSLAMVQSLGVQTASSLAQSLIMSTESLSNIVDNGFRAILRRPATQAEIQYWDAQLQSQTVTPGQFMQSLLTSNEFFTLAYNSIK